MLGKRRGAWALRLLLADTAVLVVSFAAAYRVRVGLNAVLDRQAGPWGHYAWLLELILPVWLTSLALLGGYGVRWLDRSRAWLAVGAGASGLALVATVLFLSREGEINRSLIILFSTISTLGLWGEREAVRAWLRRRRRHRHWLRHALIVGTDERAARLVAALTAYPEAGWSVRGCVSLSEGESSRAVAGAPVIGTLGDVPDILQGEAVVDEVFFTLPLDRLAEAADALAACESLGVDTRVLVDVHRPARAQPFVEELFGLPFYGFSPDLTRQSALAMKRALDLVGALTLLILALPLLTVLGLLIKVTSRGPLLFRQERSGLHGRRFWMYKFRTMVPGAEEMREQIAGLNELTGPVFKATADPRVTWVGRWLRRWSLDELPQFANVLKGEMSLVGPRPLPVYEARLIKGAQRRRLAMRPGITGLWQVTGRTMLDFEEWMRLDLEYVDHWGLLLDIQILLRTIPAVIVGRGAV